MKYEVKYGDINGGNECVMKFDTEDEAEIAIQEELECFKDYYKYEDYDYGDFGNRTDFWISGGNMYAYWERMWM